MARFRLRRSRTVHSELSLPSAFIHDDNITRRAYESLNHHVDDFPNSVLCPISRMPMIDPVLTLDGYSYERSEIMKWFLKRKAAGRTVSSPLTGAKMECVMIPNHSLRNTISELVMKMDNNNRLK